MTDAKLAPSHLAQTQVNWICLISVIALTSFLYLAQPLLQVIDGI